MAVPRSACSCGAEYRDLRTGMTFAAVRAQLRPQVYPEKHPRAGKWRSLSRAAVLGHWHEIKLQLWKYLHSGCG